MTTLPESRIKQKEAEKQLLKMSDEELIRQFQEGVVAAYDVLYNRYKRRLHGFIYGILPDTHAVDDIFQATFLRVHRCRHGYEEKAKFSTWLYTIAKNLAFSEIRRRKNKRSVMTRSIHDIFDGEEMEIDIPIDTPAPDELLEDKLIHSCLQEAMDDIHPEFREVLVLSDVQELHIAEIEAITGLPNGTVKSRIHRARKKIKRQTQHLVAA